ncbi:MAG TPA: serine hydrolase domain-containing protein [bacterium]
MTVHQQAQWHLDAASVGMDRAAMEPGLVSLVKGVEDGRHMGAQVYVSRAGKPVLEFACGEASPGMPMTPDHLTVWFSCTKPLVAMAVALLYDRGKLDVDDRVQRYLPAFANGKEACTIRNVLTHQGGFTGATSILANNTWDETLAAICAYPAEYPPGTKAGYHPTAGWFVLGEIVRVVDGRPIDRFVAEEILQPLGLKDSHMGIASAEQATLGKQLATVALGKTEAKHYATQEFIERFNSSPEIARVVPSGGMRGPARELGRFYEWLLARGRWGKQQLVSRAAVDLFTACHRWELPDKTLAGAPLPWGLGFMLYGSGDVSPTASRRVFGHSGMVSSVAFADPERALVCVVITNGLIDPLNNGRRLRDANGPIIKACGPL